MGMTQVVADTLADAGAGKALFRTPVPRPRTTSETLPSPVLPRPQRSSQLPTGISTVPLPPAVAPRRPTWSSSAIDLTLALAIAGAAAVLGLLPLPLALAAAAVWPALLVAGGTHRRPALGVDRLARAGRVLRTGGRAAVVVLAASSLAVTVELIALAGVVGAFALASAVHALLDARPRGLRLVLAGRPRDVRAALAALPPGSEHVVVAACLTRTAKEPWGDLPTYVGFEASPAVARHHGADALVVLPGARLCPTDVRRLHWSLAGVGTDLYLGSGLLDVE